MKNIKLPKFLKNRSLKVILNCFAFAGICYSLSVLASDDLSGVMESVKSDFGESSTFIKLLYLLEIIVGVYTYHKTKNIAAMLGIVIISIFMTYALSHWVFS